MAFCWISGTLLLKYFKLFLFYFIMISNYLIRHIVIHTSFSWVTKRCLSSLSICYVKVFLNNFFFFCLLFYFLNTMTIDTQDRLEYWLGGIGKWNHFENAIHLIDWLIWIWIWCSWTKQWRVGDCCCNASWCNCICRRICSSRYSRVSIFRISCWHSLFCFVQSKCVDVVKRFIYFAISFRNSLLSGNYTNFFVFIIIYLFEFNVGKFKLYDRNEYCDSSRNNSTNRQSTRLCRWAS